MDINEKGKTVRILEAATYLFCMKGFHNATISDIAEAAGIGKGTIYEYFKSKSELFIKMVEYNIKKYYEDLCRVIGSADGFMNKLWYFIDYHQRTIGENMALLDAMMQRGRAYLDAETGKSVHRFLMKQREIIITMLVEILALGEKEGRIRDLDKYFIADVFYDMVVRCSLRSILHKLDSDQMKKENEMLIDFLVNGIGISN